jgi:hypothetical protein
MEVNPYQLPLQNEIYIQQNIVSSISQSKDNGNVRLFINQGFHYAKINETSVFPLTTEIGLEINYFYEAALVCQYIFQNFNSSPSKNFVIKNFWNCGNAFSVAPYSASLMHPKIQIFAGAGHAEGHEPDETKASTSVILYFWTLKPTLFLETNISQNFKFSLGGGYQMIFFNNTLNIVPKNLFYFNAVASLALYF